MTGAFSEHFETLVSHINEQDNMAEIHSKEINRFQREFMTIMETAGIHMAGEKEKDSGVIHFAIPEGAAM